MVSEHQLQQIAAIGRDAGVSAGLRSVVSAGLLALQGDVALLAPVSELLALSDRLATVTGRKTPSGAHWCPTGESLPPRDALDPHGAVVVMPQSVGLIAGDAALVLDLGDALIVARQGNQEVSASIDLQELSGPAALLPASLAGLALAGPGRRDLGGGLAVERTGSDQLRISLQGLGVNCPPDVGQVFAAELCSLVARAATASIAARIELERTLQVVTP
jgi:hypothetical protein